MDTEIDNDIDNEIDNEIDLDSLKNSTIHLRNSFRIF